MQNQFRLDDLLARNVVPQWFEGIAIVQLVCRQRRAEDRESAFPRPQDILIALGGSITTAGESDGNPVQAAAHVLGLMLGNDVPVRLRLAVSQATATDGGFASLTEFSEALAYFERPNPEGIIEAFRQRALQASPRETVHTSRVDAAPAVEKPKPVTPPAAPRRVSRVAVVAAFSVLAATLVWTIGQRLPDLLTPTVSTAESSTPEASAVRTNTKRATASTSTPQHPHVDAAPTAKRVALTDPSTRSVVSTLPALQVVATTLSYHYPTILPSEPVVVIEPRTQRAVVTLGGVTHADLDASEKIYSQADRDVTLPLSVYPKFPNDSRPVSPSAGTTLELTIAANGLVERVRMLTTPRNIHEFMLLSAAKAWRFEPATIDGRPVRFRQLMTLTAIP